MDHWGLFELPSSSLFNGPWSGEFRSLADSSAGPFGLTFSVCIAEGAGGPGILFLGAGILRDLKYCLLFVSRMEAPRPFPAAGLARNFEFLLVWEKAHDLGPKAGLVDHEFEVAGVLDLGADSGTS